MINEKCQNKYKSFPTDAESFIRIVEQCTRSSSCGGCPAEYTKEYTTGDCFDMAIGRIGCFLKATQEYELKNNKQEEKI